jgi:hypothetical protein
VERIDIRIVLEGDDPFKAIRMLGQPMLDRDALRGKIKSLEDDAAPRVFVIEGERLSGKSYTIQFLTFIAKKRSKFKVVPIDLERQFKAAGAAIPPDRIGKSIVNSLGLEARELETMPVMAEEQDARYVLEFCEWIVGVVDRSPTRHCIVFDHFGKALLTQGSSDLVIELCTRALASVNLVVVLLEYDRLRDLETAVGIVEHYRIPMIDPNVMVQDLTRFFLAVYAERQQLGGSSPTDGIKVLAKTATQNVLAKVQDGEDRLLQLRAAIAQELRQDETVPVTPAGGG